VGLDQLEPLEQLEWYPMGWYPMGWLDWDLKIQLDHLEIQDLIHQVDHHPEVKSRSPNHHLLVLIARQML
jgi:hypothetical protein